jgi:hypothetical protein
MGVMQHEGGGCTGRGFAAVDPTGFCARFYDYITKAPAAGGPGWTILLDKSATPVDKTVSVDYTTDVLTCVGHGFHSGDRVQYVNNGGSAIGGLSSGSYYWVRKIDADNFYLASSFLYAQFDGSQAGNRINLTSNGSGTHTFTLAGPYIVVAPAVPASVNEPAKVLKIGYDTNVAAQVYQRWYMSWDDTNKIARGVWVSATVTTVDGGDFAYDFRFGDTLGSVASRITTTWYWSVLDRIIADSGWIEGEDKTGTLAADAAVGSNVVLQLGAGEAANFTVGWWYYIWDFYLRCYVNYVKVVARDTDNHTITVQVLSNNFSAGARIGSYGHRYYWTNLAGSGSRLLPYVSGAPGYVMFDQNLYVHNNFATANFSYATSPLISASPRDRGDYACVQPMLVESSRPNSGTSEGMTEQLGSTDNVILTYGAMAAMQDVRTIDGKDYITTNGGSGYQYLILDTESAV